jgi:hypothetical protein
MIHTRRLLSALCLVATCGSQAQSGTPFTDPLDGRFDMSEYLAENAFGFLPVPIIITEPAVDGGLGMMGLFFHEDDETAEKRRQAMRTSENPSRHLLPPNVSAVAGAYTGNESWFVGGGHVGFFRQGTIRYRLGGGYGDVDMDYYSIGNNNLENPLSINTESLFLIQSLKFKLGELPLYLGPIQRYVNAELSPASDLGEVLPPGTPPETVDALTDLLTSDVALSALGVELELDTRNNFFTPTAGYYLDFRYGAYRDAFGSDIDYDWYNLSSLNYFELTEHWRFALRLEAEVADSDEPLPPFATPSIDLRGIPAARYQGDYVGVLEGELTWQPDLRWSALAFLGAGRATYDSSDFSSASSEVARGVGFRYQIARRYGLHAGIDVAWGPEDTVWYIQVGSAW